MKSLYIIKAGSTFATEVKRLGDFEEWVRRGLVDVAYPVAALIAARVPFLGICYGHQLLGRAAGGEVGYHPRGREVGTVSIELTPEGQRDPLFKGIPARFVAHATHAQSLLRLPDGAVHLAFNGFESHHAFRVGESAWGVQFHPEYTREIMQTYVSDEIAGLEAAGEDAGALREVVSDAPFAGRVLTNFASFVSRTL